MARHLVLARCGKASLHEGWLAGGARNWDLALAPYEALEHPLRGNFVLPVTPGAKWSGLHHALTHWPQWREYKYIWLPDDDIAADALRVNTMFALAEAYGAALAAPALSQDSYFAHFLAMQNKSCLARAVSFVEARMPCFRRDALERVLPLLAETHTGWGLDVVWPQRLGYKDMYVFDCVTMRHTRPVADEAAMRAGMQHYMQKYGAEMILKTLALYRAGGLAAYAAPVDFLNDYSKGFDYLCEKNPKLTMEILRQQSRQLG